MEIYSKGEYPSNELSNFAHHEFVIDGITCQSMEGFLQSLKYRSEKRQIHICSLVGKEAKLKGRYKILWKLTQNVWWNGEKIKRNGDEFQKLIDRAYEALFQNEGFRKALADSKDEPLEHSMGRCDPQKTILTVDEFTSRLVRLRELI